jgi:LCP family protein required for cell wall assembly
MPDTRDRPPAPEAPPEYNVYRARPRLLRGRRSGGSFLDELRNRGGRGRRPGTVAKPRRRVTIWKVLAGIAIALVGWVLLSAVLFLVSSVVQGNHASDSAKAALDSGGPGLFSPTTTLVLGSDQRPKGSKEPGASTSGPSRSDSIMLLRTGGGHSAKLSIPRDTVVDIPGHGRNKINAAYAFGGAALAIQTVRQYLGIPINHVIEINFTSFPDLIDAMGGIDYTGGCVVSKINGGFKNGGYTLRLRAGTTHINGKQALALARTRHNLCNPREDDLNRALRQQKIISAMKSRMMSPTGFIRMPLIAWNAPKTIKSDMGGPSLMAFATGMATSGNAQTRILRPSGVVTLPDGGAGLVVSPSEKHAEVQRFLKG